MPGNASPLVCRIFSNSGAEKHHKEVVGRLDLEEQHLSCRYLAPSKGCVLRSAAQKRVHACPFKEP